MSINFKPAGTAGRCAAAQLAAVALILLASCTLDLDYDKYAVVYGVAEYDSTQGSSSWPNLAYTDDDALAMEILLNQQGYEVSPYTRVDADATLANLQADFATIAAKASANDLFLFYYSGHGGQVYPSPPADSETAPGSDEPDEWIFLHGSLATTLPPPSYTDLDLTVSDDQLAAMLASVPCARKIVIFDACNSGGFIGNVLETDPIAPDSTAGSDGMFTTIGETIRLYVNFEDYGSDITPADAVVIAASGEREESWEGMYNHGVMTYFLLESASKADRNGDGYITVSESYHHIYKKIDSEWNNTWEAQVIYDVFFPRISGGPIDYVLFTD